VRVAERQDTTAGQTESRPPAPHLGGPLGSSGAAPADRHPPQDPNSGKPTQPSAGLAAPPIHADFPARQPAPEIDVAEPTPTDTAGESVTADDADQGGTATPSSSSTAAGAATSSTAAGAATSSTAAGAASPSTAAGAADGPSSADAAATGDDADAKDGEQSAVGDDPAGKPVQTRRIARVLRHANPVRAARTTSAWARRPAGRLIIPGVMALLLLAGAGTAGAYFVPKALKAGAQTSATRANPLDPTLPPRSAVPSDPAGGGVPSLPAASGAPIQPGASGPRPADALAGWAQQVGTRAGIPVVAVEAYGYAELVMARTAPSCHLSWTTIAALAYVESAHGSYNNSVLGADGEVTPPIYGLPLDGKGGRQLIKDTDQGTLDGDTTYDRAIGPLQFIPATWVANAIDADNNGTADPNDIDDASLTAASYLCKNGRDMSRADSWWEAILSYNAVQPYAQKVFDTANLYGQRSRV
jgi:hypothetical protein